jgi:formate dehydrogenase maturation protein FdhE
MGVFAMTTAAHFRQLLAPLFDCPECNGRKVLRYWHFSQGNVSDAEVRLEPCRMCKGTGSNGNTARS